MLISLRSLKGLKLVIKVLWIPVSKKSYLAFMVISLRRFRRDRDLLFAITRDLFPLSPKTMLPFTKKLYSRPMIGVKKEEETLWSGLWPENRSVRL